MEVINLKRTTLIATSLAMVALVATLSINQTVYADSESSFRPFIQRLMEKFNISESDMTSFMEEFKVEKQERRAENMAEKLNAAVESGLLTFEQKAELEALMNNFHNSKEDLQELSREEKKALHEEHRTEIQAWAEANGVDLAEILGNPEGGKGHGRGRGFGPNN